MSLSSLNPIPILDVSLRSHFRSRLGLSLRLPVLFPFGPQTPEEKEEFDKDAACFSESSLTISEQSSCHRFVVRRLIIIRYSSAYLASKYGFDLLNLEMKDSPYNALGYVTQAVITPDSREAWATIRDIQRLLELDAVVAVTEQRQFKPIAWSVGSVVTDEDVDISENQGIARYAATQSRSQSEQKIARQNAGVFNPDSREPAPLPQSAVITASVSSKSMRILPRLSHDSSDISSDVSVSTLSNPTHKHSLLIFFTVIVLGVGFLISSKNK